MVAKPKRRTTHVAAAAPPPLLCAVPPEIDPPPVPDVGGARLYAIMVTQYKWVNRTGLHYCFLERAPADQIDVVRRAFAHWTAQGIGLNFVEVANAAAAEIRIAFSQPGSWSHVGTANLRVPPGAATMNFGLRQLDLRTEWGWATALHEIGHALGLPHEHQNPKAGIVWDQSRIYATFGGPPNYWTKAQIDQNIIQKIPAANVQGTEWDPTSIMHYPFDAGLIKRPQPYDVRGTPQNLQLSAGDLKVARYFYPVRTPTRRMALGTAPLPATVGGQADFVLEPKETRTYTLEAGGADARVVLFEDYKGEPVYLSADDNAGTGKKAALRLKLHRGRTYIARVRTSYAAAGRKPTLRVS